MGREHCQNKAMLISNPHITHIFTLFLQHTVDNLETFDFERSWKSHLLSLEGRTKVRERRKGWGVSGLERGGRDGECLG